MEYKIFWCKVNKYYAEKWLSSNFLDWKPWIFISSCVVTDRAKKKWLKFLKDNIHLLKWDEKMYVSGCWAFEKGEENKNFFTIYEELEKYRDKIVLLPEDPADNGEGFKKIPNLPKLYTKKFVLIQGWCDSYCTFCLTVQKRGKHFYREKEEILEEILTAESEWVKEIVLTWVNLSAWGLETTNDTHLSRFHILLQYILDNSDIPRIRISSMGPEFINDDTFKIFSDSRIYPHFHYSVQSGSSNILKKMNRHYDGPYIRKILEKTKNIKRKDGVEVSIGADIIVWFPGETDEDFKETLGLVQDWLITKMHAFPFSSHKHWESVPAWFYENQVSEKVKKERLDVLLLESENQRSAFIERQAGKIFHVLVEKVKGETFEGWTENYIEANEKNFEVISGEIKRNEIIVWKLKK